MAKRETPGALKWHRGTSGRPITSAEENEAIARYQAGEARAIDLVVRAYTGHIKRLCARVSGGEMEDKQQEAAIGVMHAAKRFDPARGVLFWTYASWFALAFAQRSAKLYRKFVVLPQTVGSRSIASKLPQIMAQHYARTGEELSAEGVAQLCGGQASDARKVLEPPRAVSIDALFDMGFELPAAEVESAVEAALRGEQIASVRDALSSLTRQEREVVNRRCMAEGATLAQVGIQLGVSRERVRQLQVSATKKLKKRFLAAEAVNG